MRVPSAVLAALLALAAPAAAAAACPPDRPPTVRVVLELPQARTDAGKTLAWLARQKAHEAPAAGQTHGYQRVGLTKSRRAVGSDYRLRYRQSPTGLCGRLAGLTVTLTLAELTVYVAREIPRGSCAWQEVFAHEMQHVAVERRTLGSLRPQVARYTRRVAAALGAVRARDERDLQRRVGLYIENFQQQLSAELSRHTRSGHARIDTKAEYDRLSSACDGQLQDVLRTAGR